MRCIIWFSILVFILSSCVQSRVNSILNIDSSDIINIDTLSEYDFKFKKKYLPIKITLKDSSVITYRNHRDSVLYVLKSFLYNRFSREITYNLKTQNKIIERTFFYNVNYGDIIKYKQNGDTLEKIKIDSAFYFNIDSVQSYCLKNLGFNIYKNDCWNFIMDYTDVLYHIQYSVNHNGDYLKYNLPLEKRDSLYLIMYFRNLYIDGRTGEIKLSKPFHFNREE